MFLVNNFNINFNFSQHLPWRQPYFPIEIDILLGRIPLFNQSIEENMLDLDNNVYSAAYLKQFIFEILHGENNIKASLDEFENFLLDNDSSLLCDFDKIKITNLKTAVEFLFPNILLTKFSSENFNETLTKRLAEIIGKNLFKNPGKFRINDAKPSQEFNFYYLEPSRIKYELKKLFYLTNQKLLLFNNKSNITEFIIKVGAQFLIHFLSIHPFENGNGRVARLLIAYLFTSLTPLPISIYTRKNANLNYLDCLRDERIKSPNTESKLASLMLDSVYFTLEKICIDFDIYPNIFE